MNTTIMIKIIWQKLVCVLSTINNYYRARDKACSITRQGHVTSTDRIILFSLIGLNTMIVDSSFHHYQQNFITLTCKRESDRN